MIGDTLNAITLRSLTGAVFAVFAAIGSVEAEECAGSELKPMAILDKENIGSKMKVCIEGHRVGDLLPERMEWQIRNHNMFIRPVRHESLPQAHRLNILTEKYNGQSQIVAPWDITGWVAGIPFPQIDMADPQAAIKVIWNHYLGWGNGDAFGTVKGVGQPDFVFALVDGDIGIERLQYWHFTRIYMAGRLEGGDSKHRLGQEPIFHKNLLFATYPQDIKGLGTFSIRYLTPKLDDIWAYIRAVRRVRRLSGGAWVDPIGGTDQLQDDIAFNAHPTWYSDYKMLGKRWLFNVADSQRGKPESQREAWLVDGKTMEQQFPLLAHQAPYWNFDDYWMPREAYVIETIPPEYHPYSKKIVYIDTENWNFIGAEAFDRKGDFWKAQNYSWRAYPSADGVLDPVTGGVERYWLATQAAFIDFQRRHATVLLIGNGAAPNIPVRDEEVTLVGLEAAGR